MDKDVYKQRFLELKKHLPFKYGVVFFNLFPKYNRNLLYNFIRGTRIDWKLLETLESIFIK